MKHGMKKTIDEIIFDLTALGYFRYADQRHLDELQAELKRSFSEHKEIGRVFFEDANRKTVSKDFRYINCDLEELIEWQAEDALYLIRISFEKFGLPFVYDYLGFNAGKGNQLAVDKFEINSKRYNLDNTDQSQYACDFVKIINDQMEILQSAERLYLVAPGNDGDFIFLDGDLKRYFENHITFLRDTFTPMEPNTWIEKHKEAY